MTNITGPNYQIEQYGIAGASGSSDPSNIGADENKEKLNTIMSKFAKGDLNGEEAVRQLGKIDGVTNVSRNGNDNSQQVVISFNYNGTDYSMSCSGAAQKSGNDDKKVKIITMSQSSFDKLEPKVKSYFINAGTNIGGGIVRLAYNESIWPQGVDMSLSAIKEYVAQPQSGAANPSNPSGQDTNNNTEKQSAPEVKTKVNLNGQRKVQTESTNNDKSVASSSDVQSSLGTSAPSDSGSDAAGKLNNIMTKFTQGNLNGKDTVDQLNKIEGVTEVSKNGNDNSQQVVISFRYNGQDYSMSCSGAAQKFGDDKIRVKTTAMNKSVFDNLDPEVKKYFLNVGTNISGGVLRLAYNESIWPQGVDMSLSAIKEYVAQKQSGAANPSGPSDTQSGQKTDPQDVQSRDEQKRKKIQSNPFADNYVKEHKYSSGSARANEYYNISIHDHAIKYALSDQTENDLKELEQNTEKEKIYADFMSKVLFSGNEFYKNSVELEVVMDDVKNDPELMKMSGKESNFREAIQKAFDKAVIYNTDYEHANRFMIQENLRDFATSAVETNDSNFGLNQFNLSDEDRKRIAGLLGTAISMDRIGKTENGEPKIGEIRNKIDELCASGKSNEEIADELISFIKDKTAEFIKDYQAKNKPAEPENKTEEADREEISQLLTSIKNNSNAAESLKALIDKGFDVKVTAESDKFVVVVRKDKVSVTFTLPDSAKTDLEKYGFIEKSNNTRSGSGEDDVKKPGSIFEAIDITKISTEKIDWTSVPKTVTSGGVTTHPAFERAKYEITTEMDKYKSQLKEYVKTVLGDKYNESQFESIYNGAIISTADKYAGTSGYSMQNFVRDCLEKIESLYNPAPNYGKYTDFMNKVEESNKTEVYTLLTSDNVSVDTLKALQGKGLDVKVTATSNGYDAVVTKDGVSVTFTLPDSAKTDLEKYGFIESGSGEDDAKVTELIFNSIDITKSGTEKIDWSSWPQSNTSGGVTTHPAFEHAKYVITTEMDKYKSELKQYVKTVLGDKYNESQFESIYNGAIISTADKYAGKDGFSMRDLVKACLEQMKSLYNPTPNYGNYTVFMNKVEESNRTDVYTLLTSDNVSVDTLKALQGKGLDVKVTEKSDKYEAVVTKDGESVTLTLPKDAKAALVSAGFIKDEPKTFADSVDITATSSEDVNLNNKKGVKTTAVSTLLMRELAEYNQIIETHAKTILGDNYDSQYLDIYNSVLKSVSDKYERLYKHGEVFSMQDVIYTFLNDIDSALKAKAKENIKALEPEVPDVPSGKKGEQSNGSKGNRDNTTPQDQMK